MVGVNAMIEQAHHSHLAAPPLFIAIEYPYFKERKETIGLPRKI